MSKIITENVDFIIRIDNKEYSYSQYRKQAYNFAFETLGYGYFNDNFPSIESPIQTYINTRVKRAFGDDSLVFVTSYSEHQGSFIVTFSIFVFATFMNYGSFRESLDYLRDDINYFFRDAFSNNTSVSVDYSTRQNRTLLNLHRNLLSNALSPLYRQINILKGVVGFIGLIAVGFSFYSVYKVENVAPQSISNEVIEQAVNKEINRQNTQHTNEELLRLLQDIKKDTAK